MQIGFHPTAPPTARADIFIIPRFFAIAALLAIAAIPRHLARTNEMQSRQRIAIGHHQHVRKTPRGHLCRLVCLLHPPISFLILSILLILSKKFSRPTRKRHLRIHSVALLHRNSALQKHADMRSTSFLRIFSFCASACQPEMAESSSV